MLSPVTELSTEDRMVFANLHFSGDESDDFRSEASSFIILGSTRHLVHVGCSEYILNSSNIVFPEIPSSGELEHVLLATTLTLTGRHGVSVEAEIYSETRVFAKGMLTFLSMK